MKNIGSFYYKNEQGGIICELCPHNCHLRDGQIGICGVRQIIDGELFTLNYGEVSSAALDPIEKKPLYHYKPGKKILSVGSFGCNFSCGFCQNYSIAKEYPNTQYIPPEELIKIAVKAKEDGNIGIAFTYNEPSIWYEYIRDVISANHEDLDLVLVSNGYISKEPLLELLPHIKAMNIDLKAFNKGFYNSVCKGDMDNVLNTIKLASSKCHVEVTTLVIPGYNDAAEELEDLAKWLAAVDKDIPLHLSAYHPAYNFHVPPTSLEELLAAYNTAIKHLSYVYIGNVLGAETKTYCPKCHEPLIKRNGFNTEVLIYKNKCPFCEEHINIIL